MNNPFAQFLEVVEETHGGHGLFFTLAAGGRGREFRHEIPARWGTRRRETHRRHRMAPASRSPLRRRAVRPRRRPGSQALPPDQVRCLRNSKCGWWFPLAPGWVRSEERRVGEE